jgi:hypothetical protein
MNDPEEKNIASIKQYICKTCLEFNKEESLSVLNFLKKEHIENKLINQNFDGIKINLDKINDEIILKLYNFILYKNNKS